MIEKHSRGDILNTSHKRNESRKGYSYRYTCFLMLLASPIAFSYSFKEKNRYVIFLLKTSMLGSLVLFLCVAGVEPRTLYILTLQYSTTE